MNPRNPRSPRNPPSPRDAAILERCGAVLEELGITADRELAAEMMQTIVKLAGDEPGRGEMLLLLRALKELRHAFRVFKPFRGQRKITMFGSARTPPNDPNYQAAEAFARLASDAGFMIITGAGPGIMEAGNVGAGQAHSFGVAIRLPFEQATNAAISGDRKLIHFRYFFSRKLIFVKEAHAIALFPGGFGTLDEAFEVLTLMQTGRADPMPIVLVAAEGDTYWQQWDQFVRSELLAKGLISPEDLALYHLAPGPREAVEHIARFYCNYQSMRYVNDDLVLRVRYAPTPAELERLSGEFADIVTAGGIALATAAEAEPEPAPPPLPDLPRLVLRFNRRELARLRMLIDRLNELPSLPPLGATAPAAAQVGADESDRTVATVDDGGDAEG